jgi:hypothetical protein
MTRAQLKAAVYAWVYGATSTTVIFAEQDSPRPDPPYLTVKVGTVASVGQEETREMVDPGAPALATQHYFGDREVTVSVQAFGDGAMDLARKAARALATETTMAQLAAANLCHRGTIPAVNELTELLDTGFEERAQFDAALAFGEDYTDIVGLIEVVEGEGTFENPPNPNIVVPFTADKNA